MLRRVMDFLGSGHSLEVLDCTKPSDEYRSGGVWFTFGTDEKKAEHWCCWETIEEFGVDKECWWSSPFSEDGDG